MWGEGWLSFKPYLELKSRRLARGATQWRARDADVPNGMLAVCFLNLGAQC